MKYYLILSKYQVLITNSFCTSLQMLLCLIVLVKAKKVILSV